MLIIPALASSGNYYRAELGLLLRSPIEFELMRLEQLATNTTHSNFYQEGVLTLSPVVVGADHYEAILHLSNINPLRLQLQNLE
jgi:hypothetical protein